MPNACYGANKPMEGKALAEKLLKGKSGRLIITADTPTWYDFQIMKSPTINQLKNGTIKFCGINAVKTTYIAAIINSSSDFREKWLKK